MSGPFFVFKSMHHYTFQSSISLLTGEILQLHIPYSSGTLISNFIYRSMKIIDCSHSSNTNNMASSSENYFTKPLFSILNSSYNENNSSANNSRPKDTSTKSDEGYDYFTIIILTMLSLILVIGTVGNSVVCYVFGFKQRKQRSVPETLFLYLGAIDLTTSLVNPSLYIYWTITKYSRWDFGVIGCKILAPMAPISVTLSALIILIIAVDRYFVICGDFGRSYSRTRIHLAVVVATGFAVCLYIPYIVLLRVKDGFPCFVVSTADPVYAYPTISALLLQDVGFILVLSITNFKSFSALRRQGCSMMEQSLYARRARSNRRVAKILLAMSCVFCLLVLPRDIMLLANIISWLNPPGFGLTQTLKNINALFKVLQTANSCVNVFIYSKMHTKFRVHLKAICYLACGCRGKLGSGPHSAITAIVSISPTKMSRLGALDGTPAGTPELPRKKVDHKKNLNGSSARNLKLDTDSEKWPKVRFLSSENSIDF